MQSRDIIRAVDIDFRESNISSEINEEINKYVKSLIVKKINQIKKTESEQRGDDKFEVTDELKEKVKSDVLASDDVKKYKEFLAQNVRKRIENYSMIRNEIDNMNELHILGSHVEQLGFQDLVMKSLKELIKISSDNIDDYNNVCGQLTSKINGYISSYKGVELKFRKKYNNLFDEKDSLQILLNMRKLYTIKKDIDGVELYDMFNMFDNIDMSNLLSDICFYNCANNIKSNLLNELNHSDRGVGKLIESNIITNKLLGCLLRNTLQRNTEDYPDFPIITDNAVTCLDTTYTTTMTDTKVYSTRTLGELLFEITNDDLKHIDKSQRQQIYMTYDGSRPKSDEYWKWNGLQVFDIDLKDWVKRGNNIKKLKDRLFETLTDFRWFLWICFSSSGRGIHIYTKVAPPHHVYIKDEAKNNQISEYCYRISYYTKASIIYTLFYKIKDEFGFTEEDFMTAGNESQYSTGFELKCLDNTVGRITSGIRLTYDPDVMVNMNFMDLPIFYSLCQTYNGFNYKKDIDNIIFRNTKISRSALDTIDELYQQIKNPDKIEPEKKVNISELVLQGYDITKYKELPLSAIKYKLRYEVCNTLAALYGKDGLQLAHMILRSSECRNEKEINAFYASALRNKKEASKFGLDVLQKVGVVKSVNKEFDETLVDKYKLFLKKQIEKSAEVSEQDYTMKLGDGEYLGTDESKLLSLLRQDKINLIYAPPAAGKTETIKSLARQKRVMLVLPFISVIKNKIESDESIMELFDCYYDNKDISKIEHGINAVTTFDKFSRADYEKISRMFDYIVIDEEHLLFNSQYRIHTTSNSIKKLRQLQYIASNDPFSAKILMMTGTPTGSEFFFKNNGNFIRVYKKMMDKSMEFHICNDLLDATTRMAYKCYQLINQNHKIIIPTNKGDIYTEKLVGMIRHLLGRDVRYGYYKRANNEQDIVANINQSNTVGDYEIIFCTNYLSVGIDINDTTNPFAVMYLGNWSGFEIEQFNSRIRRQNIQSFYFIKTLTNNNKFDDLLYEEPEFQLRLTDEDIANFKDDKEIATKKQEFIAVYDPLLNNITTPGFSTIAGQIKFNKEEYELVNFENKYSECFQHPLKVASVLASYGYNISVSLDFDGLDINLQTELKQVGIDSAKEEKVRKNDLMIGTFMDLIKLNKYVSKQTMLEFNNTIEYIMKNSYDIVEDRDMADYVSVTFNQFAQPEKIFVKSKVALDKMIRPAYFLVQRYSPNKCYDIINQYIDSNGILKKKNFQRAVNLLKLVEAHGNNELSVGVEKVIENIYEYTDKFIVDENYLVSYSSYMTYIDNLTNDYIAFLGMNIRTRYGYDKIRESILEIFKDITVPEKHGKNIRFGYNKMPEQDSASIINRRSVDILIEKMFAVTNDVISSSKLKLRENHIILEPQKF